MLDQKPRRTALPAPAGADEHPGAGELLTLERELELSLPESLARVERLRQPGAPIPDHDRSPAVFAFGDHALEGVVFDRMRLGRHRQALDGGVERRALRD